MTYKNVRVFLLALLVFCIVVLFFMPIFGREFGYLNDYSAFECDVREYCLFPETTQLFAVGRPLQAVLLNIELLFVSGIHSLQLIRLFFVLMIGIAASVFFLHLQNAFNINRYSAALLSVLTFTLPSMTINSFWIAQSIPGIFPLFFVILAHHLMQKRNEGDRNRVLIDVAVFSLIFSSLLIYPPATFFFLTLTFIKFVFGTKDKGDSGVGWANLAAIFAEIMILLAACIVYYLSIKFIFKPILLMSNPWGLDFQAHYNEIDNNYSAYKFSLSFDPASKVTQLYDLFILVFSAWFPPLKWNLITPFAFLFILVLSWASFSTPYVKNLRASWKIILGVTLSIAIPVLTALPVLFAQGNYPMLYRVTFASMATVPVAIVFVIDRAHLAGKLPLFLVLVVSSGFILAAEVASHKRLTLMISRLSAEYQHVLDAVSHEDLEGKKEILISPLAAPPDPSGFLYRDFGYTAVNSITKGMVNAASRAIGRNIDGYRVAYDPLGPRYISDISDGIKFNRDGYPSFVSSYKGISGREEFGRWTDSEEAVIVFAQPLPQNFTLKIKAGTSAALVGKPVKVIVGATQLEVKFSKNEATQVALKVTTDGNARSIVFRFPSIKSPMELGLSTDTRRLGLALIDLQID